MNYISFYADSLKKFLKIRAPIRVIFDASDGTAGLVLQKLFQGERKIKATFLNAKPDGNFPAHGPNPWGGKAIESLGRRVKAARADLGAIFDGDGDRVFFVDDRGRDVSGDAAAVFLGQAFRGQAILDVRAGYVTREYFSSAGRKVVESRVGHLFIKKLMRERHIQFGAEASGHYYFAVKDSAGTLYFDSGILAAIHMITQNSKLKTQNLKLSDWIDALPKIHRIPETNFEVRNKKGIIKKIERRFKESARRISKIDGLRMDFSAPEYWFSVRPSNTEDLLRLNLEAKDKNVLKQKLAELKRLIKRNQ